MTICRYQMDRTAKTRVYRLYCEAYREETRVSTMALHVFSIFEENLIDFAVRYFTQPADEAVSLYARIFSNHGVSI